MKLFEITTQMQTLQQLLELPEGEITPEDLEKINEIQVIMEQNFVAKTDSYIGLIRSIESDIEACKMEKRRVSAIQKTKEKVVKSLKNWMKICLGKVPDRKVETPTNRLSVRKGREKPVFEDESTSKELLEIMPEKFVRLKKELNKDAVMEEFKKTGVIPSGIKIVREESLNIK